MVLSAFSRLIIWWRSESTMWHSLLLCGCGYRTTPWGKRLVVLPCTKNKIWSKEIQALQYQYAIFLYSFKLNLPEKNEYGTFCVNYDIIIINNSILFYSTNIQFNRNLFRAFLLNMVTLVSRWEYVLLIYYTVRHVLYIICHFVNCNRSIHYDWELWYLDLL